MDGIDGCVGGWMDGPMSAWMNDRFVMLGLTRDFKSGSNLRSCGS